MDGAWSEPKCHTGARKKRGAATHQPTAPKKRRARASHKWSVWYWLLLFLSFVDLIVDVISHWYYFVLSKFKRRSPLRLLLNQLKRASSIKQWQETAEALDVVMDNDVWRQNPVDDNYDYMLISARFRSLVVARKRNDPLALEDIIRSGALRNIGSLCSANLYNVAYGGTKLLIEDYISEVLRCLEVLANDNSVPAEFFRSTLQSFGRTALVLHGGSRFGLCHLGIVRALLRENLLPTIITGASVGAIVAAFVCSTPPGKLVDAIETLGYELENGDYNLDGPCDGNDGIFRRFLHSRYPPEILLFEMLVSRQLGNMTFQEAFEVSGLVLNVSILTKSRGGKQEPERLLNYLTTPSILVRSAVRASLGSVRLPRKNPPVLLAKDYLGNVVPYSTENIVYLPANNLKYIYSRDSAYNRLSELFHVNNYIVSLPRPYFAPNLLSEFKYRGQRQLVHNIIHLVRTIVRHRISQLSVLGLLPKCLQVLFVDENIPGGFQVHIVPEPDSLLRDCIRTLESENIEQKVAHWIHLGERAVWPVYAIIWARTAIEFALAGLCNTQTSTAAESPTFSSSTDDEDIVEDVIEDVVEDD